MHILIHAGNIGVKKRGKECGIRSGRMRDGSRLFTHLEGGVDAS
jgi:hypothetical protein